MRKDWIYPVFAKGDTVRRIDTGYPWEGMIEGQTYIVDEVDPDGTITFDGLTRVYHSIHFTLVRKAA